MAGDEVVPNDERVNAVAEIMHREVRGGAADARWAESVAIEMVDWLLSGVDAERIAREYVEHYDEGRLADGRRRNAVVRRLAAAMRR